MSRQQIRSVIHSGGENQSDGDRIAMNLTYSNAWLRQEENQYLTCPPEIARGFDSELRALLGYTMANFGLGYFSPVEFNPGQPDTLPPQFACLESTDPNDADVGRAKTF
jgi:ectoine hydroxylase-related dioxygenase (phytanoyl-CoA dioxygenase family)